MRMKLVKMQGCGNDFLVIDSMSGEAPSFSPKEISFICDRHYGVGADGFIILHSGDDVHAKWDFYNSDGSEAEMCGNGSRCAIRFLADHHFPDAEVIGIETLAGLIRGRVVNGDIVEVALFSDKDHNLEYEEKIIEANQQMHQVFFINTGVPHAVIQVDDILDFPIAEVGKSLVHHEAFGSGGTNVTFFRGRWAVR